MDKEILEKYIRAGEIAKEAKEFSRTLLKEGCAYLEIANKTEDKIIELGGKLAFPVNVSVNEIAAHHVPSSEEKLTLKEGDLVKIDIGVHVNGCIADTAYSFSVGADEENEKLIKASEEALAKAIETVKDGVSVSEIGEVIGSTIGSHGFQPIRNLNGHLIENYDLHAGLNVPNYNNGNKTILENGMVVAIEPFATTGQGKIIEGKESEVFRLEKQGNLRIGKEILKFISEEYKTLPFAKKWLIKKFGKFKTELVLKACLKNGWIKQYNVLRERAGAKVSQSEHTIIILEKETKIIT